VPLRDHLKRLSNEAAVKKALEELNITPRRGVAETPRCSKEAIDRLSTPRRYKYGRGVAFRRNVVNHDDRLLKVLDLVFNSRREPVGAFVNSKLPQVKGQYFSVVNPRVDRDGIRATVYHPPSLFFR
jgi:hypothetical protein